MEITQVKVFLVDEEKLKAYVSIVLDDCFLVSDLKVIQGPNGRFISMPSKRKKGTSLPREAAIPESSAGDGRRCPAQSLDRRRRVTAASELPPPRPAPTGMRFSRRIRA